MTSRRDALRLDAAEVLRTLFRGGGPSLDERLRDEQRGGAQRGGDGLLVRDADLAPFVDTEAADAADAEVFFPHAAFPVLSQKVSCVSRAFCVCVDFPPHFEKRETPS